MRKWILGFGLFAAGLSLFDARDASACGGCFHPPTQDVSDITDERMLLTVSQTQTTLYDQIRYSGSPSSFAWVLPIHGTVDVGLSADVLFDSIDALTQTQIVPPESTCAGPPNCGGAFPTSFATNSAAGGATGVTVTKAENVGPYATVQLHATDSSALEDWLQENGFVIPTDVAPVIAEYVNEGFDFLAMKLLPNEGVQAMRPVRVTSPGASLSLPLRMAAIGTGASVGITLWVVGDGRYEPQNFPFFHIEDMDLIWDWSTSLSNYTTLRAKDEAALNGAGWEIESSIELAETLITNAIETGGQQVTPYGFYATSPASDDYLSIPASTSDEGGVADGGASSQGESAEDVRSDDIQALFAGLSGPSVRVTRMRSDIAHAAMTQDFVLQASADQSELSNVREVTSSINETCVQYPSCGGLLGGCDASSSPPSSGSGSNNAWLAGLAAALALVAYRIARVLRARERR